MLVGATAFITLVIVILMRCKSSIPETAAEELAPIPGYMFGVTILVVGVSCGCAYLAQFLVTKAYTNVKVPALARPVVAGLGVTMMTNSVAMYLHAVISVTFVIYKIVLRREIAHGRGQS